MLDPTSVAWSVGSGVLANYLYSKLAAIAPKVLRPVASATFHGPAILIKEADSALDQARNELQERYRLSKTVRIFLQDDSLYGGALNPLFNNIYCGNRLDKRKLRENLISCRAHDEIFIRNTIAGYSISEIINDICKTIKGKLVHHSYSSRYILYSSLNEIRDSIKSIEYVSQNLKEIYDADTKIENATFSSFISEYLEYQLERVEHIMVSGIDAATRKPAVRHLLEKSYVPLTLTGPRPLPKDSDGEQSADWRGNAFDIVEQTPRVVIRGPAGCGKTTLLHWFIHKTLTPIRTNAEPLRELPVFISLRALGARKIQDWSLSNIFYLTLGSELLSSKIPNRFFESLIEANVRVTLLIDGVDELPEHSRDPFWKFISRTCERFDKIAFVITSRNLSAAHVADGRYRHDIFFDAELYARAKREWRPAAGFMEFVIQPFTNYEIENFIIRWHEGLDPTLVRRDQLRSIASYPQNLIDQLTSEENSAALELSRTPLLCALVCMVSFFRSGNLPTSKRELYEWAVSLLIVARDEAKGVAEDDKFRNFDETRRRAILQYIAYKMQFSTRRRGTGQSIEERTDTILEYIDTWRKKSLANPPASSEILTFLINRCALVRSPAVGVVDFVHRTFMEFLTANEMANVGDASPAAELFKREQWLSTLQFCMDTEDGAVPFASQVALTIMEQIGTSRQPAKETRTDLLKLCTILGSAPKLTQESIKTLRLLPKKLMPPRVIEVDFLSKLPFEIIGSYLNYNNSLGWSDKELIAAVSILIQHKDERSITVLEEGYTTSSNKDITKLINASGKVPVRSHKAIHKRMLNGSFLNENIVFTSEDLRDPNVKKIFHSRKNIARDISLQCPFNCDIDRDSKILKNAWKVHVIGADKRDWEIFEECNFVFNSCQTLMISDSRNFSLRQISVQWPNINNLRVHNCREFAIESIGDLVDVTVVEFTECRGEFDFSDIEIPPKLKEVMFLNSSKPVGAAHLPSDLLQIA